MRERAKERAKRKGLPGRGKGRCKGSEVGTSLEELEEPVRQCGPRGVKEAGVVRDEVGELGQGQVKGAL